MGRMHAPGKGISDSALPYRRTQPTWLKTTAEDRFSRYRTRLAPEIPEDLYHLIKKAVAVRKHLERNRKDKDAKFRLILIESRIHRLARYYKKAGQLAPNWKYESSTASALVA
ncbi:unnamed protein product [Rhizophagus irregularis]|uniref:Small ribosomal subunit protein uS15 N-terminal domain-containing protein n=1 Tax=Rhizophagus irregularis TaxID=588596 RepID=A0A915YW45_9GLOM|nr:unnamed protein product [Rhizophagus irregularis]CAB5347788.1 unnamed protein product [Rhizophagus irregularis]